MKTMTRIVLAILVASVALGVVTAGDPAKKEAGKEVTLTGYITDEYCGAKNANGEGADCARDCAKKGAKLGIFSDGKLYILSDKDMALANLGHKVIVTGTVGEGNVVQVKSIEKAKEAEG